MRPENTGTLNGVSSRAAASADEDAYYMDRMAEILDSFGTLSPPSYTSRVSSQLYLGNQTNADDEDLLSAIGVTHVLNMAGTRNFDPTRSPYKKSTGIKSFLMIQAEDYDEYDITRHFPDTNAFLDHAYSSGGIAFVHCSLGVNRSGAVVAAYLMVSEHRSLLDVVADLKAKRSLIITNMGFRRQLIRYARCRGLLDPVDRKQTESASRSEVTTTTSVAGDSNGSSYVNTTPKGDDDDSTKTSCHSESGVEGPIDDDDAATVGYHAYDSSINGAMDSRQRHFQISKSSDSSVVDGERSNGNDKRRHLIPSSASVEDPYLVSRRNRLLCDVDAAIGRQQYDDNLDGGDSTSVGGWTNSRSRHETGSISDTSSSSSGSVVSGFRYERGRRSVELSSNGAVGSYDNYASNLSRYEIPSAFRSATSTSGSLFDQTMATYNSSRIARPMSAQSAVGSFQHDPPTNRYRTTPYQNKTDDDVERFLEEADRRAKMAASTRRSVPTIGYCWDTSTGSSSRSIVTAARRPSAASSATISNSCCSSPTLTGLGSRRSYGSERNVTSRLAATTRLLSDMTEELDRFNL